MTTVAVQSLTRALEALDYPEAADPYLVREEIERALTSLRQGPRVLDDLDVQSLIRKEIAKVGSEAELARRMGITRQSLHAVYRADRAPGPSVLGYFRLRKMGGRTRYEMLD